MHIARAHARARYLVVVVISPDLPSLAHLLSGSKRAGDPGGCFSVPRSAVAVEGADVGFRKALAACL